MLLANLSTSRYADEGGRRYLVAPVTMIVPGVLNGSQGPLYYSPREIKRSVESWEGKPITLRHPRNERGDLVSANGRGVRLGTIRNAQYQGKLIAEAWFDPKAVRRENPSLLRKLEQGEQTELSTGLFTENRPVKNGEYQGHKYTHVARNYRPDHLAILPDEVGACSVADGCGVNVNAQPHSKNTGQFKRPGQGTGKGEIHEYAQIGAFDLSLVSEEDAALGADAYEQEEAGHNPASWVADEGKWQKAKTAASKGKYSGSSYYAVVTHIYKNMGGTVKRKSKGTTDNSTPGRRRALKALAKTKRANKRKFQRGDTGGYKVGGKKVSRKTFAKKIGGVPKSYKENEEGDMPLTKKQRKELVGNLLDCCWEEEDRPMLEELTDNQLTGLTEQIKKTQELELVANAAREALGQKDLKANEMPAALKKALAKKKGDGDEDEEEEEEEPTKNDKGEKVTTTNKGETPKPLTEEEWLKQAPTGVQEDLAFARNEKAKQKQELIGRLTDNMSGDRKQKAEAVYAKMGLAELGEIAPPPPRPTTNYGTVPPVDNQADEEIPMGTPTWNFAPVKN